MVAGESLGLFRVGRGGPTGGSSANLVQADVLLATGG